MNDGPAQLNLGPNVLPPVDPVAGDPGDFMADLDEIAADVVQAPTAFAPSSPPPSGPEASPAPARSPASASRGVAFPLLDSDDGPCVLVGEFRCVEGTDIPAIMVYEAVNTAGAANLPANHKRGAWLGDLTHDAREDDLLKYFGAGAYHLAVKNAQGGFIKWARVQVGRSAQPAGRVVAHIPGATLGGFPGPAPQPLASDEPPAWAKALILDVNGLKAQRAAPSDDYIERVVSDAENAVKRIEALRGLGERLSASLGGRQTAPEDESPEEDEGLIDQTSAVLGNALAGAAKLKETLNGFKMLVKAGA